MSALSVSGLGLMRGWPWSFEASEINGRHLRPNVQSSSSPHPPNDHPAIGQSSFSAIAPRPTLSSPAVTVPQRPSAT